MKYEITKEYSFDAAHMVLSQNLEPCKCHNLHGHTYKVIVKLVADILDDCDMVVDYGYLDQIVKPIIDSMDHSFLYSDLDSESKLLEVVESMNLRKYYIEGLSPTAENIAKSICEKIHIEITHNDTFKNVYKLSVTVKETDKTSATISVEI